ncbi:hypothetical protein HDV01_002373, partial [Terramyces sp. JEL0728]
SRYIQIWGDGEHEDLKEITKGYTSMMNEFTFILNEYTDSQTAFREKLKDIRTLYDEISATRQKLKAAAEKCQRAIKAGKPYEVLVADRDFLEKQEREEVAVYESKKRLLLQEGLSAQFNGILKFALKAKQVGIYGNHLAAQIPQFEVKPGEDLPAFKGRSMTNQIYSDFQHALMRLPDLELIESNHSYFQPEIIDSSNISQHYPGSDISPAAEQLNFPSSNWSEAKDISPPAEQLNTRGYSSTNWAEQEDSGIPEKPPRNRITEDITVRMEEVSIAPVADMLHRSYENPW